MNGFDCFVDGFSLIRRPGLRRYFVVPVLINSVVLALVLTFTFYNFNDWIDQVMGWFPGWMQALYWLVWGLAFIVLLVVALFVFTMLANVIASPFNAILSVKVETHLTGREPQSQMSPWLVFPRTISRELAKVLYILPRLLGLVILTLIPGLNVLSPVLWVLFGAWMMAIEYTDYGADNNDVGFRELRRRLGRRRFKALGFGLPLYFLLAVPIVNLVLMPVGVAGGTRFWVENLKSA